MHVRDMLLQRQKELKDSIASVQAELEDIDRALAAIGQPVRDIGQPKPEKVTRAVSSSVIQHKMPVNDAIVLAVEAGKKTPVNILAYLKDELDVHTTLNSVRSRVSPLKKEGRIAHDGDGWIPVEKNGAPSAGDADAPLLASHQG